VGAALWLFPACGGLVPPDRGEGTVILSLPGAPAAESPVAESPVAGSRAGVPVPVLKGMKYVVSCVGPTGTKTVTSEGGGTVIIGLAAGDWYIGVEARYQEILAGLGEGNVEVRAGTSNAATVKMTPTGAIGSVIAAASTGLRIVNAKAAEGGAYGIGEPFQYQLIATFGDGGAADISDWASPDDFSCNFSTAGPAAVSIASSSFLSGIPYSPVSVTVKTMQDRVDWANTQGGAHTLLLYADENISSNLLDIDNAAITIKSGNEGTGGVRTLSLDIAGGNMFVVSGFDGKLTLGRNITLRGVAPNFSPLVAVSSGELIMEDGSAITGNAGPSTIGGAVYVNAGTFTMNGGVIGGDDPAEKNAALFGGGVFMNGGTFTMNAGAISGNMICGTPGGGGGVYVVSGTFAMNGGVISDNTTTMDGGGVYVASGTFTMNNSASVSGNEATRSGGGVYVASGTFTMNNTTSISGNTANGTGANEGGGGVYIQTGTFTLNHGTVYGVPDSAQNTAAGRGNAIYDRGGTHTNFTLPISYYGNSYANTTISQ
jgi:hypothetical protein